MFAPINGFVLPFRALSSLFKPGIRPFVIVPLVLNIIVFVAIAWLAIDFFDQFMTAHLPAGTWWDLLRPLLWVVFALAYALATFYGFTIVANLIASPFNGMLAARYEQHLTGRAPEGELSLLASIWPSIVGELYKLGYFLKWALPILVMFLIPGLNLIAPFVWIAFGFWFLAIEYADYPMGNYDLPPRLQRQRLARKRFKSLGFGAGVSVLMLLLGFIAMPAAVIAATRFWVEDLRHIDL